MTSALDQSEAGIYASVGSAIGHQVALQASFNIDLIQKLSFQTCLYTTSMVISSIFTQGFIPSSMMESVIVPVMTKAIIVLFVCPMSARRSLKWH